MGDDCLGDEGYVAIMRAIEELIQREGGYVNHPSDKGGPTKYGITEVVARQHGYNGNMQDLPQDMAERIYIETYYIAPGFNRISSRVIAEELLDSAVLHGIGAAVKWLQHALNRLNKRGTLYPDLKTDGVMGSVTLKALETYLASRKHDGTELVLARALNCLQGAAMLNYDGDWSEDFIFGWLRTRVAL